MNKIVVILIALVVTLFGAELQYAKSLDEAKARASKENKAIALIIVKNGCGWCNKLKRETLKEQRVVVKLNNNFIPLILNKDVDEVPSEFQARMAPTTYFLDKNANKLMHPVPGFWDAESYLSYIDDALKKLK